MQTYLERRFGTVGCALSISGQDEDPNSEEIKRFMIDPVCMFLIVVGRAKLGFNYTELENVVDLSGSSNPDGQKQLILRLSRLSKTNKRKKFFYKVVPDNMTVYYANMLINDAPSRRTEYQTVQR